MKKLIFLILLAFFAHSAIAQDNQVDYAEYEINLNVAALTANHFFPFNSTNDYKVSIELVGKNGYGLFGTLKGSTSSNIYQYMTAYRKVLIGESGDFKARLILPIKSLEEFKIRITVLEANFTVIIPGPCCLTANDDDRVAFDTYAIEEIETSVNPLLDNTDATLNITKILEGTSTIDELLSAQRDLFIMDGYFSTAEEKLKALQTVFLRTLSTNHSQ